MYRILPGLFTAQASATPAVQSDFFNGSDADSGTAALQQTARSLQQSEHPDLGVDGG